MGYRLPPPPDKRKHIDDTATESIITIDNGSVSYIAIPCFYSHVLRFSRCEEMIVDHNGWPSPGHPDESFQRWMRRDDHINLIDEGYDTVEIVFDDPPTGLEASGDIDVDIVRLKVKAVCPDAISEDLSVPFSIFVTGQTVEPDDWPEGETFVPDELRSVVTKGTLLVKAGIISIGS